MLGFYFFSRLTNCNNLLTRRMKYVSPVIAILALALSSTAGCQFPGIPARASARNESSRNVVVWKPGTYFTEGDRIEYECEKGWQIPKFEQRSIQCQKDGTWSADIPRCDRVSDWIPESCNSSSSSEWSVTYPRNENTSYEITQISIEPCPGSETSSDVTVVLDGLECARIDSDLIFNCQRVTQDPTSERTVKMNFGLPVFRPTVSTLLNEGDNCGIPPVPYGADFELKNSTSGKRSVILKCDAPPSLKIVTCNQWTGKWGPYPRCSTDVEDSTTSAVQTTSLYDGACGELTLPESAIILRDEGHNITLGCPSPLQLNGSESITCDVTDGTWKPQVGTKWPECVLVEPQLEEPPLSQKLQEDETWMWIVIGVGVGVVLLFWVAAVKRKAIHYLFANTGATLNA